MIRHFRSNIKLDLVCGAWRVLSGVSACSLYMQLLSSAVLCMPLDTRDGPDVIE